MNKRLFTLVSIILVLGMFLGACQTTAPATEVPVAVDCKAASALEAEGSYQVPAPNRRLLQRGFCVRRSP